jgi:hypothetical protein
MGKRKQFKNCRVLSPSNSNQKPSVHLRLGKTVEKSPTSIFSRLGFKAPVSNKNLILPKQPTPLQLYLSSRMTELSALGFSKDKIYSTCFIEYKELPDLHKMKWILQSMLKEREYNVGFILQYFLLNDNFFIYFLGSVCTV